MPKRHLPAATQLAVDGVLSRASLTAGGLNPYLGDRLVREGAGLRVAPSTYVLTRAPSDAQLVLAAQLHAGADLTVTGLVACRLLGLQDVPHDGAVDVLSAERRRVSTAWVRVHPTTRPPEHWLVAGVRVAEPHRAVVDAARRLRSLRDVRALVLGAICGRWCGVDGLRAELEAGPRNGTALGRRALRDAEAGAWSAPEAEVADVARELVRRRRLPPFLLNPTLLLDGVVLGQPDGWFVGLGLGWEVDSRRHHAEEESFDATLARHDHFGRRGLQLLHVTPRRARALGTAYGDVLVDAVTARRAAGQPEPGGLVVRPHDPRARALRRAPIS